MDKLGYIKRIMSNLLILYKISSKYFIAIIICSSLSAFLPVVSIYLLQDFLDKLITNGYAVELIVLILLYLFVSLMASLISFALDYLFKRYTLIIERDLTVDILSKLNNLDLLEFEDPETHNNIRRVFSNSIGMFITIFSIIINLLAGSIALLTSILYVETQSRWLGIILSVIPILFIKSYNKLANLEYMTNVEQTPYNKENWYVSFLLTQDSAFKENRIFNFSSFIVSKFTSNVKKLLKDERKLFGYRFKYLMVPEIILSIFVILIMIYGIYSSKQEILQVGFVVAFIQLSNKIFDSSKIIINSLISLKSNDLYTNEYFILLNLIKNKENKSRKIPLVSIDSIYLENISYINCNGKTVLSNINLALEKNNIYFILGSNGSGKTTLLKIISRLYENIEGNYFLNNCNSSKFCNQDILERMSYLFQDFKQYEFTFEENVIIGNLKRKNNEKIQELNTLLKIINETNLSGINLGNWFENSRNLSGGEWQKLAFARTLYSDGDVMMFDEPSSMVDANFSENLFSIIRGLSKGKIICVVTHDISKIENSDNIIFMKNGTVKECGKHSDLLSNSSDYFEFINNTSEL